MPLIILAILFFVPPAFATPLSYEDLFGQWPYPQEPKVEVMRLDKEARHKILMEYKEKRDKIKYRGQASRLIVELSWLNPFVVFVKPDGDPFTLMSPIYYGSKPRRG